jgi:glycosyltransferase involved in cell wall biosynthesis
MKPKIAYIVKRYPRFSETFIVNEILAHEKEGLGIELFSLRPPVDTHFQDLISRVRAPLTYLSDGQVKAADLWQAIRNAKGLMRERPDSIFSVLSEMNTLDAFCGIQLAIHCAQRGIDHIHAHFASSAASVAAVASALTGIPFSITAHAKDIFHESVRHEDLQRKLTAAKVVFTVSEYNLRYLQQQFPETCSRFVRLYNGMHLDDFSYSSPENRSPKIVAVGRFVEKKGFEDLILACHELTRRGFDYSCQLVGGGELEGKLAAMIEKLQLQEQVFLLGSQPQNKVKELIRNAAVMAAPCVHGEDGNRDGLPTVLLEAMALGTPCISTPVTGIPEVIKHMTTGLIVPERSPKELADALALMIGSPELRVRCSDEARRLIESDFDAIQNAHLQQQYFCNPFEEPLRAKLQLTAV